MRATFILFALVVFCGCAKTKNAITTTPVHDTTVINHHDTSTVYAHYVVGSWQKGYSRLTFTNDSVFFIDGTTYGYRYLASGDSLYRYYSATQILPVFGLSVSNDGNTLTLLPVHPDYSPLIYTRL